MSVSDIDFDTNSLVPVVEPTKNQYLPTQLQQFVFLSRYAKWLEKENRRETWEETVDRYVNFFETKFPDTYPSELIRSSILNLRTMPSMRALMTAGPALERDNAAGFNCSYIAIDHPRAFDEALYILMCFHPDTLVVTTRGDIPIKDIVQGDSVRSYDEKTGKFKWCTVTSQIKTPSAERDKVEILLDNGQTIRCTADHKWLTSNRSWVEAKDLTPEDDLVAPTFDVYKITNTVSGKTYVGITGKGYERRFSEHCYGAFSLNKDNLLSKTLRKHGVESFTIELVDVAHSFSDAVQKEKMWIEKTESYDPNGYNLTVGGEGTLGLKWSEESKKNASENAYERTEEHRAAAAARLDKYRDQITATRQKPENREKARLNNLGEKNPQYGKKISEETRQLLKELNSGEKNAFYGKQHSEETKKLLSEQKIGKMVGPDNPFFGKKHSEETRAKMRGPRGPRIKNKEQEEVSA